jgi:hypothetical protein
MLGVDGMEKTGGGVTAGGRAAVVAVGGGGRLSRLTGLFIFTGTVFLAAVALFAAAFGRARTSQETSCPYSDTILLYV